MHDAIEIVKCDIAEVQLPQRFLPDFLGYNYVAIDQITIRDYTDSRINADGARMPRRRSPPRLYLDKIRQQWIIRDGASFVRTGCAESDRVGAEGRLQQYLGEKHQPAPSADPLIADILLAYAREHLPHIATGKHVAYTITNLSKWWSDRKLSDVTARNCRAFAEKRKPAAARRDLETLRAAIGHWHREHGPLPMVPAVIMPQKPQPRERWLTRGEAARLLKAARHTRHLARFILIGLYTGSRSKPIFGLRWDWIDFERGIMRRRAAGAVETRKRTPPVRLGSRILTHLRRWQRLDGPISPYVCHYDGRPIKTTIGKSWGKALKAAGLERGITPHTLRHTRATWLMQAGIDPWEAAGHLGMTVGMLESTYAKHSPDYQKRAAEV